MKSHKNKFGKWIENDSIAVFFGNKNSPEHTITDKIQFGHQVHKADLLKVDRSPQASNHFLKDSDGLFTDEKNVKLGVYTADCVPCFVYNNGKLFGLHLGWRSLHQGLLEKALSQISKSYETQLFIGPHIQSSSFEIGEEVFKKFQDIMTKHSSDDWFEQLANKKFKLSMKKIILHKAEAFNPVVFSSEVDTFTCLDHCSYRKQKHTSSRNISFAFLK